MNSALLKRLGIKETQVIQPTKVTRGVKETNDSGIVIDFDGAVITDLSAKKYLIFCLEFSSAIITLEPPLNSNLGFANKSIDLRNSGKSYIANSWSKLSDISASAKMFFIVDIVESLLPSFTKILGLISAKFFNKLIVSLDNFIIY